MPMTQAQLATASHQNVRLVPVEPQVKLAGTCNLSLRGVSGNAGSAKSADPLCYDTSSAMEDDMRDRKFEIVHDRVRIRDGVPRQWLVYANGKLRAECTSAQSAKDFVAIENERDASRG